MSAAIEHLLEKLKDPKKEIALVRDGLKTTLIEAFLNQEKLPIKEVLIRLNIPTSIYFTKKRNRKVLDTHATEKFLRLITVIITAEKILGQHETKSWIYRKIPSLGNEIPIDLLDTEAGHRLVMQTLLQIEQGVYS